MHVRQAEIAWEVCAAEIRSAQRLAKDEDDEEAAMEEAEEETSGMEPDGFGMEKAEVEFHLAQDAEAESKHLATEQQLEVESKHLVVDPVLVSENQAILESERR